MAQNRGDFNGGEPAGRFNCPLRMPQREGWRQGGAPSRAAFQEIYWQTGVTPVVPPQEPVKFEPPPRAPPMFPRFEVLFGRFGVIAAANA
jgi:hypothetical protein